MERDQNIAIETLALFIRYYLTVSTPFEYVRDTRDNKLNPTEGYRALIARLGLSMDADDPKQLVLFPEMIARDDPPDHVAEPGLPDPIRAARRRSPC